MSQPDTSADRQAADAVVRHHAQLADDLHRLSDRLLAAAEHGDWAHAQQAQRDLSAWLQRELLPHAQAEEAALYPAAAQRPEGKLLVDGMLNEHKTILGLVRELDRAASPARAAAAGRAVTALFDTHLTKENELILPIVLESADASLAQILAGMHEILGGQGDDHGANQGGCGGGGACGCGGDQGRPDAEAAVLSIDPRIDVRDLPHDIRHATVLSALDSVPPGGALVLVAPHAPRPLLAQIEDRYDGAFGVDWLQSGPEVWQIRLERTAN